MLELTFLPSNLKEKPGDETKRLNENGSKQETRVHTLRSMPGCYIGFQSDSREVSRVHRLCYWNLDGCRGSASYGCDRNEQKINNLVLKIQVRG